MIPTKSSDQQFNWLLDFGLGLGFAVMWVMALMAALGWLLENVTP